MPPVNREIEAYQKQLNAAKRLVQLREAKEDLLRYCHLSMPDPMDPDNPERSRYQTHPIHQFLANELMEVEAGRCLRLIVSVQPRIGKSELVSKRFPSWCMGRDPYKQIVTASCTDDLASEFGRENRWVMKSAFYQQVFPGTAVRRGSASTERIQTQQGGLLQAVGIGGTLVGKGADILVIDDPVKSADEARSPAYRDRCWSWFTQVAMSRVMGTMGAVVICATRWHEDDLIGRLTNPKNPYYSAEEAAKWRVINIPAYADLDDPLGREPGEILWPERTPREHLESMRRLDPEGFNALYMGRPAPPEGAFFKARGISTYKPNQLPKNLRYYAASDHAVSLEQRRDKTCMGVVGVDENENVYVLPDLVWRQMDAEVQVEAMIDLMARHRPLFWWAEKGHISMSLGPFLRKRMNETRTYATIDERIPSKDKMTRAQAIQARMSMGKVFWPEFAPWYADAREELLNFPNGMHDDLVDFISWVGIGLDSLVRADVRSAPKRSVQTGSIQWIIQAAAAKRTEAAANDDTRYLA